MVAEGGHGAQQAIRLGRSEGGRDDRQLHRLFLEQRYAERFFEHPAQFMPVVRWRGRGIVHALFAIATAQISSEEHTSELQSLMRISYAVFCLPKKHTETIDNT